METDPTDMAISGVRHPTLAELKGSSHPSISEHLAACSMCRSVVAADDELELGDPIPLDLPKGLVSENAFKWPADPMARGGMAQIFSDEDHRLGRTVIFKAPREGDDLPAGMADMFQRRVTAEARILAKLQHPSIVTIYEMGKATVGWPFCVLEKVDGVALRDRLDELAEAEASDGTPPYLPYEQTQGRQADPSFDVYSFGITLYEVVSGRTPFDWRHVSSPDARTQQLGAFLAWLRAGVPAPPAMPRDPELSGIIARAMASSTAERFTADELVRALKQYLTGDLVFSHRYSATGRLARWARRHRAGTVAIASLLLFAVGGTLVWAQLSRRAQQEAELRAIASSARANASEKGREADQANREAEAAEALADQAKRESKDADAMRREADRKRRAAEDKRREFEQAALRAKDDADDAFKRYVQAQKDKEESDRARDAALAAEQQAVRERDAARAAQLAADAAREAARTARELADKERDAARAGATAAEAERDAARATAAAAEKEHDAARTAQLAAEKERDAAIAARASVEKERDEARRKLAELERFRDRDREPAPTPSPGPAPPPNP